MGKFPRNWLSLKLPGDEAYETKKTPGGVFFVYLKVIFP
jgi:hypothetical protein